MLVSGHVFSYYLQLLLLAKISIYVLIVQRLRRLTKGGFRLVGGGGGPQSVVVICRFTYERGAGRHVCRSTYKRVNISPLLILQSLH